jgi:hypothetical protein
MSLLAEELPFTPPEARTTMPSSRPNALERYFEKSRHPYFLPTHPSMEWRRRRMLRSAADFRMGADSDDSSDVFARRCILSHRKAGLGHFLEKWPDVDGASLECASTRSTTAGELASAFRTTEDTQWQGKADSAQGPGPGWTIGCSTFQTGFACPWRRGTAGPARNAAGPLTSRTSSAEARIGQELDLMLDEPRRGRGTLYVPVAAACLRAVAGRVRGVVKKRYFTTSYGPGASGSIWSWQRAGSQRQSQDWRKRLRRLMLARR